MNKIDKGINLNQLSELAKKDPRYATILGNLSAMDKVIKGMAKDIITAHSDNPDAYFIKTELMNQCYSLYLFNAERQATAGTTWTLATLIEKCSSQMIEYDLKERITKMIDTFGQTRIHTGERINWID